MKTEIMVLLAAVALASGCAANSTDSPDTGDPQDPGTMPGNQTGNVTTVTYTGSGFQPRTVTVQQGDTVVWQSETSTPMWVASDQHPIHSQYAGTTRSDHCSSGDQASSAFDQCSTGDRFSFTFEKTGEWNYHNHERSTHTGTVTVE